MTCVRRDVWRVRQAHTTGTDIKQHSAAKALATVGKKFLAGLDFGENALLKDGIEKFMPMSFETVNREAARFLVDESRYVYTTPKSYLKLLKVQRAMDRNYIYISLSHSIDRDREMNAACFRRIR